MNLYLDDDISSKELVALLRKAGHDALAPADASLAGARDPAHLLFAIIGGRVFMSHNYYDFELLHDLVTGAGGRHLGVLVVRKDNNKAKDMKPAAIVAALGKLIQSGMDLANEYVILNDYR
jgi:hypothetical protein